jgi:hypothetical protein
VAEKGNDRLSAKTPRPTMSLRMTCTLCVRTNWKEIWGKAFFFHPKFPSLVHVVKKEGKEILVAPTSIQTAAMFCCEWEDMHLVQGLAGDGGQEAGEAGGIDGSIQVLVRELADVTADPQQLPALCGKYSKYSTGPAV